jgi:hypothetical protein
MYVSLFTLLYFTNSTRYLFSCLGTYPFNTVLSIHWDISILVSSLTVIPVCAQHMYLYQDKQLFPDEPIEAAAATIAWGSG